MNRSLSASCLLSTCIAVLWLLACDQPGFDAQTNAEKTRAAEATPALPPREELPSPQVLDSRVEELPNIQPEEGRVEEPAPAPAPVCRARLQYDPSQILCNINEAQTATLWERVTEWTPRVQSLTNPAAHWISPLAAVSQTFNGAQVQACPFVPDSDKLIFVSHFTLEQATTIRLEAVIDDVGQLRIWRAADSAQEVYISSRQPKVDAQVALAAGRYTVVIDGIDTGRGATGTIASIFGAGGAVLRQTEANRAWCIFRVTAQTDVVAFLRDAAICRFCMTGLDNPPPR